VLSLGLDLLAATSPTAGPDADTAWSEGISRPRPTPLARRWLISTAPSRQSTARPHGYPSFVLRDLVHRPSAIADHFQAAERVVDRIEQP
jgi:hypothetical protein